MNKLKKKAIKSILESNGMFNLRFIVYWTKTMNFKIWMQTADPKVYAISSQSYLCENGVLY